MGQEFQPVHPFWTGDVPDFDKEYERVVGLHYDLREPRPHKKILGTERDPRRCAVCGLAQPAVTFDAEAHLIAACLGNRTIFSCEECDACNLGKGKTDEDELGKMLLPHRAIGRVRGRKGTPKVKAEEGKSHVGGGPFDGGLQIMLDRDDPSIRFTYTEANTVELSMPAPSYRPAWALRSILRSVWLAMDDAARERQAWLRALVTGEKAPSEPEYFEFVLPHQIDSVLLEAWEKRASSRCATARLVVRLAFVKMALVWCSPDSERLVHLPSLLPPFGPQQPAAARYFRMHGPDARRDASEVTFSLTYERKSPGGAGVPAPIGKPPREHPIVSLEFESTSGVARVPNAWLAKANVDAKRPYLEVRGGSFAGWLAIRLAAKNRIDLRFEYLPHLSGPGDARATLGFLSAIGEAGRLRVINPKTGRDLMLVEKDATSSKIAMPDIGPFLDNLVAINREFGIDLRVPKPPATLPVREAALLAAAIAHGRVGERPSAPLKMRMPAAMARETVALIARGLDLANDNEMPLELLGSTIDRGRERLVVVKPRLRVDAAVVDAELAAKSGDEQVELEVDCERLVHEFERWMGKAREDAAAAVPPQV